MRIERQSIAPADVPAFEREGWRVVHEHPMPMRGTGVQMERRWCEHVEGTAIVLPVEYAEKLRLYCVAIGTDAIEWVKGKVDALAPVGVLVETLDAQARLVELELHK